MDISIKNIDGGSGFDFGKTSADYAKYRDIYPEEFYRHFLENSVGIRGQKVLDVGTGSGVIPRNMYRFGADFTGTDISENQIAEAKRLAAQQGMDIAFTACPAEKMPFPESSFDAVTACQCFFYFDHDLLAPRLHSLLKKDGILAVAYMGWLSGDDSTAKASEQLVLKYNPKWTGYGEVRHENHIPEIYGRYFETVKSEMFDLDVPFTREGWNGRIKSCRGIGASLTESEVSAFSDEHMKLLSEIVPQKFTVKHFAAFTFLRAV